MHLKKFNYLIIFFNPFISFGQNDPVKWEARYGERKDEIIVTANIEKGWHIYSQNINPEVGPISTSLSFSGGNNFELIGNPVEEGASEEYDKMFEAKVSSFENRAVFRQELKRNTPLKFQAPVKAEYTACNASQCFPAKTIELRVNVPKK
jgi:hypothetical protein